MARGTSRSLAEVAFLMAIAAVHSGMHIVQTDAGHGAVFEVLGSPIFVAGIAHRRKSREFAFFFVAMLALQRFVIVNERPTGIGMSEGGHFF